jgi:hypothetical protein
MGNNPEWANVIPKQPGFSGPEFGKELTKGIKASIKKRENDSKSYKFFGDYPYSDTKADKNYAVENENRGTLLESDLGEGYTHFAIFKNDNKIADGWDYTELYDEDSRTYDNDSIKDYAKIDLLDNFPENKVSDFKVVTKNHLNKLNIDYKDTNNWYKPTNENKNIGEMTETIKRLNFKKPFNGIHNALRLIPEGYRVDNKVFEMYDGNEKYKIRWEGDKSHGSPVVLSASDKVLVNEDISKMRHLFNYKSTDHLGVVKGVDRLHEESKFKDIWSKTKSLLNETEETDKDKIIDDLLNEISSSEVKQDMKSPEKQAMVDAMDTQEAKFYKELMDSITKYLAQPGKQSLGKFKTLANHLTTFINNELTTAVDETVEPESKLDRFDEVFDGCDE